MISRNEKHTTVGTSILFLDVAIAKFMPCSCYCNSKIIFDKEYV